MSVYENMYPEFGRERVDAKRRELTTKEGRPPTYIELYAALSLEDGPPNDRMEATP